NIVTQHYAAVHIEIEHALESIVVIGSACTDDKIVPLCSITCTRIFITRVADVATQAYDTRTTDRPTTVVERETYRRTGVAQASKCGSNTHSCVDCCCSLLKRLRVYHCPHEHR